MGRWMKVQIGGEMVDGLMDDGHVDLQRMGEQVDE